MTTRARVVAGLVLAVGAGTGVALFCAMRPAPLPADASGLIVYVSDRAGAEALYARRLPDGPERPLATLPDAERDPALSPDGSRVACSMGGRIGLVDVRTGALRVLTLGVKERDAQPAFAPDGLSLVVAARAAGERNADLHLLSIPAARDAASTRRPLTLTPGLDESEPAFAPDGAAVVFVREDSLVRVGLGDGRARRLTWGLRRARAPVFLRDGRLLYLWTEGKQFGLDVLSPDLKERRTLSTGTAFYRTLAPSPDGRYLLATFTYDLGFHLLEAFLPRRTEELHLLDARGEPLQVLARSRRHTYHSPAWGR